MQSKGVSSQFQITQTDYDYSRRELDVQTEFIH